MGAARDGLRPPVRAGRWEVGRQRVTQAEAARRIEQVNPARAAAVDASATTFRTARPWLTLPDVPPHETFGLNGLNSPDGLDFHSHTWSA